MQYEIRAMSVGEIVDTSFRIVRNHFVPLVGMSAAIYLPFTLFQAYWMTSMQASVAAGGKLDIGALSVTFGAGMLVLMVVMPIVSAAIAHAVGEAYLGRPVSIGGSLREAMKIFLPIVGTGILSGLILMVGLLLFVVPGIWFALGIMVLYAINIVERSFGMTAIRRSLDLMKGQRGRGFLLYLLVIIVSMVLGGIFGLVGAISPWLGAVLQGLASAITGAFTGAVFIVFYFDIRCRKEAFDVEHLARLVHGSAPASA